MMFVDHRGCDGILHRDGRGVDVWLWDIDAHQVGKVPQVNERWIIELCGAIARRLDLGDIVVAIVNQIRSEVVNGVV